MTDGELKKLILKGKIAGSYAREMVDASYVWDALGEAAKEFPVWYEPSYGMGRWRTYVTDVEAWFWRWFGVPEK